MQMAAIEFARNVLGLKEAHSTEMNPETKEPVIDLMDEQKKVTDKGGTMRLGAYPCEIKEEYPWLLNLWTSEISVKDTGIAGNSITSISKILKKPV